MKQLRFLSPVLAIALLTGCSSNDTRPVEAPPLDQSAKSSPPPSASMLAPSMEALKNSLIDSKTQIDGALGSLSRLTDPTTPKAELRGVYDSYGNQLALINEHADKIRREAEAMRERRQEYFAKWEQREADVTSPTVRASIEARKTRLRAAHDRITTAALDARSAYDPFMRDLQDVRKFLAADLSPASTAMLGDTSKKVQADGATVKKKIDALIAELDAVLTAPN